MSTIQDQLQAGFAAVADADRALRTLVTGTATGDISTLTTTTKASIVAAINELESALSSIINDSNNTSLVTTYSAKHIEDRLAAIRDGIIGGASAAYDTLLELQQFLQSDDSQLASLLTAVGNKVDFVATQTLTSTQQGIARTNIAAAAQSDMTTAQANIVTNASNITALTTRMTTAETNITANATLIANAAAFDYATAFNTALNA